MGAMGLGWVINFPEGNRPLILEKTGGLQGFFVYVVGQDNKVEARNITVGQIADNRAIVKSGLSAGEQVVTSGSYRLEPGTRISIQAAGTAPSLETAKK